MVRMSTERIIKPRLLRKVKRENACLTCYAVKSFRGELKAQELMGSFVQGNFDDFLPKGDFASLLRCLAINRNTELKGKLAGHKK